MSATPHDLHTLALRHSEIASLRSGDEFAWLNPGRTETARALHSSGMSAQEIADAEARLARFAPWIAEAFPETAAASGRIESPLVAAPALQQALGDRFARGSSHDESVLPGRLMIKCDNALPISGSIKARGGIHEVLKHAEQLAIDAGLLRPEDDYRAFQRDEIRELLAGHQVVVGSTGNLGLSIGIMSARLGFHVTVHMSADAKQWKKDLLRSKGAEVVEHGGDYGKAVAAGRQEAQQPNAHFIDDESSRDLFVGYATAASRLAEQLSAQGIPVDARHPLCVYLPCGVGGGPGGVAWGLKLVFGDAVHCFFAEPVNSPCMLLGMLTGEHDGIAVEDIGLDNRTCADGLAVGRASAFVGRVMAPLLSGIHTVRDEHLLELLALAYDSEGLMLEPSALAGVPGIHHVLRNDAPEWQAWRTAVGLDDREVQANTTHVVWATGGSMVPEAVWQADYQRGKALLFQASASRRE
ncbi:MULTISPECIES: D-serine ammonia-lyase [unclassified Cobetia]|uniref:D-serine ammonia-lyase n=1 Tax=unclassified Cobetia TaxID=2609414 RepID=UPI00159E5920|nr:MULTISPECIES: D-serine ammonia-lyase [unclassified Cobetia]MCO7231845.1 D-serine ammonia-lyase [Cobetia sp. Dlab-2-AX]MCO7234839.1 D-serine ammonia-lyase [Cobetia sp. Dlab-2-U]NVN55389.1 D-serine ammonia-lyase [bacterium Scap17]